MVAITHLLSTSVRITLANLPNASSLKASFTPMFTLLELFVSQFSMRIVGGDRQLLWGKS